MTAIERYSNSPKWWTWFRQLICRHDWRYIDKQKLFGLQVGYIAVPKNRRFKSDMFCSKCMRVEYNAIRLANSLTIAKIKAPPKLEDLDT
jgi:hypothetical protein